MSAIPTIGTVRPYDVVILGAGYAGLMAALRLGLPKGRSRIALVSFRPDFLERVRLQEVLWRQ